MTGEGRDLLLVIRIVTDEGPSNQQPEGTHGSKEWTFDPAQESDESYLGEKRNILQTNRENPTQPDISSTYGKQG